MVDNSFLKTGKPGDVGLLFASSFLMSGENVHSEIATARLLENMGTAVLVFDADMQLSYLNQAGEVMFGTEDFVRGNVDRSGQCRDR